MKFLCNKFKNMQKCLTMQKMMDFEEILGSNSLISAIVLFVIPKRSVIDTVVFLSVCVCVSAKRKFSTHNMEDATAVFEVILQ